MYYIYKIENLINHKKYIGLTNNIVRRRNRHFTDLRCNRHDNSFLQKEFNIYGIENFSFEEVFSGEVSAEEIGEKEKYYIKYYDSYYEGYNQNLGGNFGPSNGGSYLTKSDIFSICAALEFCSRPGAVLAEIFDITTTTVSRIKKKVNHCEIIAEYDNLPIEERQAIYKIFSDSVDFIDKKAHKTILSNRRKLTQEQVFMVLVNEEYKIVSKKSLCEKFGVNNNVLYGILKKETYQDYSLDYNKITEEQKQQLVSLLRNQQKQTL